MKTTSHRFIASFAFLAFIQFSFVGRAQTVPEITERLWHKPGPVQDVPGAPRLMILYPKADTRLGFYEEATRYAGRVDPPESEVLIDGHPVKVWPGGVFTGVMNFPIGVRDLRFSSTRNGRQTTVVRRVTRSPQPLGPGRWPLAFHSNPLRAQGYGEYKDFWLRDGTRLPFRLLASPGHRAWYRIGHNDQWLPMQPARAGVEEGGAYTAEIIMDDSVTSMDTQVLSFKLSGAEFAGQPEQTIETTTTLSLRRLLPEMHLTGSVQKNFGTFMKNPTGFDRWGNWNQGTPFPVIERMGLRMRVDFGKGETGYAESESVQVLDHEQPVAMPDLPAPHINDGELKRGRLILEWPVSAMIASVVHGDGPAAVDTTPGALSISLIGARTAKSGDWNFPAASGFRRMQITDATATEPPRIGIDFSGSELWGYGWSLTPERTLRLTVRVAPNAKSTDAQKPLQGLKIMIDAGHGGDDPGALGPSGIAEADLNLVVSAHLGARLSGLGAQIQQIRLADDTVSLDDRVDRGITFDPDLFISVHHNSVGMDADPMNDAGPKVFYHYPHSRMLAEKIAAELTHLWQPGQEPRVLHEVFRVNRNISPCPSVLVECAFVCNPKDEIRLRQPEQLEALGESIAQGAVNFMK